MMISTKWIAAVAAGFLTVAVCADTLVDFARNPACNVHAAEARGQTIMAADGGMTARWDAARAKWMEFAFAKAPVTPKFGKGVFRVTVRPGAGCRIRGVNLRLVDGEGETFQFPGRIDCNDPQWQTLTFAVDAVSPKASSWGKKKNGKLDFPVRVAGFSFDFSASAGAGELAFKDVTFDPEPDGVTVREEKITLDRKNDWYVAFYEGKGNADFGPSGVALSLNAKACALFRKRPVGQFEEVSAISVKARLISGTGRIRAILTDSAKREFKCDAIALKPGENAVELLPPADIAEAKGALRLTGISILADSPYVKLEIGQVTVRGRGYAADGVSVHLRTAASENLAIWSPAAAGPPVIEVVNGNREPVQLQLHWVWRDHEKILNESQSRLSLPPGGRGEVAYRPEKLGIFYCDLTVSETARPSYKTSHRLSLAVMEPTGPTRERADGFLFGVHAHPQRYSAAEQRREAAAAALCGAKVVRSDTGWRTIQPEAGVWNFDSLDRTVSIFAAQGIELEAIYSFTPGWAKAADWKPLSPDPRRANSAPRPDYRAFAEFVRRTAERYRGKIRFFEVWNEPDLFTFANFSAEEYVEMLKIGYRETKLANPEATVLTGGFTCMPPFSGLNDQRHQHKTLTLGRGSYDVHAFHGHGPLEHYRPQIERLVAMRRDLGVTAPWYANETADNSVFSGELGQAATLFRKMIFSRARGAMGYTWYDLRNDGFEPKNVEHNFGMLTHDFQPKAVYPVFNMLARYFVKGRFVRDFADFAGGYAAEFRTGAASDWGFWLESEEVDRRIALFQTEASASHGDLFGNFSRLNPHRGVVALPVTQLPGAAHFDGAATAVGELARPLRTGGINGAAGSALEYEIFNPFDQVCEIRVTAELPAGMAANEPVRALKLQPGEKKRVAWQISGVPDERGSEAKHFARLRVSVPGAGWHFLLSGALADETILAEGGFAAKPDFRLGEKSQLRILVPADPDKAHLFWTGAADLSAEIDTALKGDRLLLRVAVTDDVHRPDFRGAEMWRGDSIQLTLKSARQSGAWDFGVTALPTGGSEVWVWRAASGFDPAAVRNAVNAEVTRDEANRRTVYTVELPGAALGLSRKDWEAGVKFNCLINDNDGEMRESFMTLAPGLGDRFDSSRWRMLKAAK